MKNLQSIQKQRGSVTLIIAFTMVVIIAFAGLAIDTGRSYGVKAQLSAAADAGAIAGARALGTGGGITQAERIATAEAAALQFFNLNYPDGFQNSTVGAPNINVTPVGNGRWNVTVNAQADTRTTFMRLIGKDGGTVGTVAQATRVNPDVMMVLDTSGSMGGKIAQLQTAAKTGFVDKFIPDVDGDRLGVVSYAAGSVLDEPINKTATRGFSRAGVNGAIDSLSAGGWTVTSDAMRKALDDLNAIPVDVRSTLRVMLVFSDGAPNVFAAQLGAQRVNVTKSGAPNTFKNPDQRNQTVPNIGLTTLPTTAVGGISVAGNLPTNTTFDECNLTRATRNITENIAGMARDQGVVIYTIGLGNQLLDVEGGAGYCGMGNDQTGANLMRRLANTDVDNPDYVSTQPRGLFCLAEQPTDLQQCFETIANDIVRLTM